MLSRTSAHSHKIIPSVELKRVSLSWNTYYPTYVYFSVIIVAFCDWYVMLFRLCITLDGQPRQKENVVAGYAGQQQVERVFRGLKDGEWLAWGPMHHGTDRKIRIHAFYCMLGISLLQYVHRQAKAAWSDLSMGQLIEELQRIQQFVLIYPWQGEKGPDRAAYVLSKQTLAQQALAKALQLDELQITQRG